MSLTSLFTEIANAIREKNGSTEGIFASEFPEKIREISSGTGEVLHNISAVTDWFEMPYIKTSPTMSDTSVMYGDGVWITTNSGQSVTWALRSEDGIHWTQVEISTKKDYWLCGAFGSGRFIIYNGDGNLVLQSTDGGLTWQSSDFEVLFEASIGRLFWLHDRFFALVANWKNYLYSSDGIDWTSGTLPVNMGGNLTLCWAFGKVFVLNEGGTILLVSSDFVTWERKSVSLAGGSSSSLLYGNGKMIVVSFGNFIYESTNGTTWTKKNITIANPFTTVKNCFFAFGKFVVFGNRDYLYYSEDGYVWTEYKVPFEGTPYGRSHALSDSMVMVPTPDDRGYLATFNGTILK